MNKEKKAIMDYTKKELTDYANKLEDIIILIDSNCFDRHSSSFFKRSLKSPLAVYCQGMALYLLKFKVERHFKFFLNDGTSDSIKQDLYKLIGEKHNLPDVFVHGEYFNSFWESKITDYKIKLVNCELFKNFAYDIVERIELDKEETIKKWNEYKDKHPIVDLFDDDEPF
jgi:hypothetical protein